MRIDLHTHSHRSDGTDTVAGLLAAARSSGLDVLAITDHDTTAGWAELDGRIPAGLTVVPGAEFSTALPNGDQFTSVHLLGYLFDPQSPAIVAEQLRLQQERERRGLRMAEKMQADGLPISPEQVMRIAAGAPVGRPHLGRALMEAGLVASVSEAFDGPLSRDSKYYVPKRDTDTRTAVELIVAAGGVPVLAHSRGRGEVAVLTPAMIEHLTSLGLVGIEVDHIDHNEDERAELRGLAGELGLLMTGSSDYHGTNKHVPLGANLTDPEQYEALIAAATSGVQVRTG